MANIVFIPNIETGDGRNTPYHYSVKSWSKWSEQYKDIKVVDNCMYVISPEDEMITHIRYSSLVWATYFNIIMMMITTLFVFGMVYFNAMIFFMISSLLFFIVRFHYMIYKFNKLNSDEE